MSVTVPVATVPGRSALPSATVEGPATVAAVAVASIDFVDALAWLAIATFVVAMVLEWRAEIDRARYVAAAAWVLFGFFWILMAPYYYGEAQSPLQTILSVAALPLCLYTGYLLVQGRESLLLLSRAVAFMGIIYLPAETIPLVRTWLIETTAAQTHFVMELFGESPGLAEGSNGYHSRFDYDTDATATGRTTYIVLACTGIGSMAIFGGLIAAVRAPLRRKLAGVAAAVGIIWALNLVRNVFIAIATPHGWFQHDLLVHVTTTYMGAEAERTSFLVAHNFIAQTLSIVALVGITYLVIKIVPEVFDPLEDVLFVLTGTEYDLASALGADAGTGGSGGGASSAERGIDDPGPADTDPTDPTDSAADDVDD